MTAVRRGLRVLRDEGVLSFLNKSAAFVARELAKEYYRMSYQPSAPRCHIMEEDWDNLVILDACRYDQFVRINTIPGRLEERTSLGSATDEFLQKNFAGTEHHDTVYVTANPMYRTSDLGDVFHEVIDVWETGWDEEQKTVPPEEVTEAALEAYASYPNKRLIAHFMQPHYPFIGDSAQQIADHAGFEYTYRKAADGTPSHDNRTVWNLIESDEIEERPALEAYDENLNVVLPHVRTLVDTFSEKTVVTSDHGNLTGERLVPFGKSRYGHPVNVYTDGLRKVPWLVIDGDSRKDVRAEQPYDDADGDSDVVSERLANLGYTDV
jgi:hypothetical protein